MGHSPYASHCAKHFACAYLIPHRNYKVDTMIAPFLQRRKLKDWMYMWIDLKNIMCSFKKSKQNEKYYIIYKIRRHAYETIHIL